MKKRRNKDLGILGEDIAANYLISAGFKIIERNFKKRYGDIDIVAKVGDTFSFIEVKTRIGDKFGRGEEAITPWKLRNLIKSVNFYKHMHPEIDGAMRIDVVSIAMTASRDVEKITRYENVSG